MDVQQKLDEIVAAIGGARSMPMSASCVVNRAELLAKLDEVREALPGSLAEAEELLGGREQMVADAQAEAQRIIESAQSERGSMVSGTEVARSAQDEADRILAQARKEAEEIRAEADDYVDSKLANFEVVLSKTVGSVERGREKLLGSGPGAEEWSEQYAQDAPERATDPQELRRRADDYVDARLGSVAAVLTKTLDAVGRGREKLLGRQPADELADQLAGPDGDQVHTNDADYIAGLATTAAYGAQTPDPYVPAQPGQQSYPQPEFAPAEPQHQPGQPQFDPQFDPQFAPQQPEYAPVAAAPDPYGMGQFPPQPEPYHPAAAPQDAYIHQQPGMYYDTGWQDPYYGQQHPQPQEFGYHDQQPPQQLPHQTQLDETSLFDTGMIDLEQVRQYEMQYEQQYGPAR